MHDAPLEAHEHLEHAEHAAHSGDNFSSLVSITIAVLAVIAATAGSLETFESGSAIIEANKAVLDQDRATDAWNLFQAKSVKKNIYSVAADFGGGKADSYRAKAAEEGSDQVKAKAQAEGLEGERKEALALSAKHETRHHHLALAATLVEIAIAISTVAIITRKRWPWIGASILGLCGAVVLGLAYLG